MGIMEVVQPTFTYVLSVILLAIVGYVAKKAADFFGSMANKNDNETVAASSEKFMSELLMIVSKAIVATNQTFVNDLKKQGKFDKTAQNEAIEKSVEYCIDLMSNDLLDYLKITYGDGIKDLLIALIESMVGEATNRLNTSKTESKYSFENIVVPCDNGISTDVIKADNPFYMKSDTGETITPV